MTPTELDAIFCAWRDDWFAKNPDKTEWFGHHACLVDSIAFSVEGLYSYDTARAVIMRGIETRQIHRYCAVTNAWRVLRPPGIEPDFSFADPPPPPAGVPIPFPAGEALLANPGPKTFSELYELAEQVKKQFGATPLGRRRGVCCPRCRHYFDIEL